MLGSEIGTTITAQIVASDIGVIFYPLIAVGFLLSFLSKNKKYKNIGQVILSLGLVYLGMNILLGSVKPIQSEPVL